jgi:hypothetical protein
MDDNDSQTGTHLSRRAMGSHPPFRFVISGDLDDFAAFCALIRGDDPKDAAKIAAMTARLTRGTAALTDAERADHAPAKPT